MVIFPIFTSDFFFYFLALFFHKKEKIGKFKENIRTYGLSSGVFFQFFLGLSFGDLLWKGTLK